jgi:HPt (histidine-containing phosphotransfer) domain-containing protein
MTPNARHSRPVQTANAVFDYTDTLQRLGGDAELYADLVRFFLEDSAELLQRLQLKVSDNDLRGTEHCAHSLKGLCANFGAHRATSAAFALEEAARGGQTDAIPQAARELEAAVTALRSALADR